MTIYGHIEEYPRVEDTKNKPMMMMSIASFVCDRRERKD